MKTITINQRIWATLASLLVLFAIAMAITMRIERQVVERHNSAAERRIRLQSAADQMCYSILEASDALRGLSSDPNSATERKRKAEADDQLSAALYELGAELHNDAPLANAIRAFEEFKNKTLLPAETKLAEFAKADGAAAAAFYKSTYHPAREAGIKMSGSLAEKVRRYAAQDLTGSESRRLTALLLVLGLTAAAIALGWLQAKGIQRALHRSIDRLDSLAGKTSAASDQIAHASQAVASGAGEQAASLEETSASLEEMASMTAQNSKGAQSAQELAAQTKASVEAGVKSNREMHAALVMIGGSAEEMDKAIEGIRDANADMAKIIKTIDEITFQTNILALNAAVEAARAGEAGMGFGVVADEVRTLARRSADAARDIGAKIENSLRRSEEGERANARIAESMGALILRSDEVRNRLEDINSRMSQIENVIAQIAVACREQALGVGQCSAAAGQVDKVTQSNAANAEQTASAAEELNKYAKLLADSVQDLIGFVGGAPEKPGTTQDEVEAILGKASASKRRNTITEFEAEAQIPMGSARGTAPTFHEE